MKSRFSKLKQSGVVLFSALLLSSCEPPKVEKVGASVKEYVIVAPAPRVQTATKSSLPLERTITNSEGKQIAVTITGKTFDKIQFIRKADGKNYALPISSLSIADQQFLTTVESSGEENLEESERPSGLTPVLEVKLQNAHERHSRVIEEIEALEAKQRSTTLAPSSPRLRGMIREVGLLEEESAEIEQEIVELERLK